MTSELAYKPGSITKNLGLQALDGGGFERLHAMLRAGFDGRLQPAKRAAFRQRTQAAIAERQLVLLNFYLHNSRPDGIDTVSVDELVRLAVREPHQPTFDLLALFALHLARVGDRKGNTGHPHGAAYLGAFVRERLWRSGRWSVEELAQASLEPFLKERVLHKGDSQTIHKTFTNYSHYMRLAGFIPSVGVQATYPKEVWTSCLYLAFDRYSLDVPPMFQPDAAALLATAVADDLHKLLGCSEEELRLLLVENVRNYVAAGGLSRLR